MEYGSQAVQDVAERINRAFELFFGNIQRKVRCSPPKFKKVRRYKSFTLKQTGWKLDEEFHTVTVKRDSLGDIYVYFVTDAKNFEVSDFVIVLKYEASKFGTFFIKHYALRITHCYDPCRRQRKT